VNGFLEEAGGWQSVGGGTVDYYATTYSNADIQISFITPAALDAKCGSSAVACVSYESGFTCAGDCSYTLLHVSQLQVWFETDYWSGASTTTRRQILNHEIGHTFGFAEHYVNDPIRGSIADGSVYSGVMDSDSGDTSGYPGYNDFYAAPYNTTEWY
jgi:hypothetical protein